MNPNAIFPVPNIKTIRKIIWLAIVLILIGFTVYYFYPENELASNVKIDNIVVYKSKRQMLIYSNGKLLKTYKISLGRQPIGAKEFEGDKKTPEGIYFINDKNPNSNYHKNLGISYPSKNDTENANRFGKSAGSDIKIHGLRNKIGFIGKFHRLVDWTLGCIAVTNKEIDELYKTVNIGAQIEIKP
ncbi:MAG: L,D-transpeptidase family protein [Fibromonadaceae bacterium]|jgi:murein L,D-transpeptidase YafK|nr:L,D-transpeptidase family protein [Fibromonadaceae bacterium]